ncbi:MAG: hypothetical protein P1U40_07220 [Coxiellaceae bacterium]|nr:hypothetical protein [Coxiellaceae bacterium]
MSRKSLSDRMHDPKYYLPGGAVLAVLSLALLKKAAEHPRYGWPVTAGIAILGAVVARRFFAPKGIGTSPGPVADDALEGSDASMAKAAAFNRARMLARGVAAFRAGGVDARSTAAVSGTPTAVATEPTAPVPVAAVSPVVPAPTSPLQSALSRSGLLQSPSQSASVSPTHASDDDTDDTELYHTPTPMGTPH